MRLIPFPCRTAAVFGAGLVLLLITTAVSCDQPVRRRDSCENRDGPQAKPPNPAAADGVWLIEASRPAHSVSVEKLLDEPHPRARSRGLLAAGRIATPGLMRAAVRLLGDEDPTVRAAAARAVGLADFAQAEEALLVRVALDDDRRVRVAALRSLGLMGGTASARALLKLAADTRTSTEIRGQVLISLALLARRGSTAVAAAAPLALGLVAGAAEPEPRITPRAPTPPIPPKAGAMKRASKPAKAMPAVMKPAMTAAVMKPAMKPAMTAAAMKPATATSPAARVGSPRGRARAVARGALPLRRAAAYLLATLVQRFDKARRGLSAKQRLRLKNVLLDASDGELRSQLGRAAIRLGLLTDPELVERAMAGGGLGRIALGALSLRPAKVKLLAKGLETLLKGFPAASCKGVEPVVLWSVLGKVADAPHGRGRKGCACDVLDAGGLYDRLTAWLKKAPARSCQAHQLARLACRAAAVADRHDGRLKRLKGCGQGALTPDEELAFQAWALGLGRLDRRPFRRLRQLWASGKTRTRVAVLTAAGRLGGLPAHGILSRGLDSKDLTLFGAAAEACRKLVKVAVPIRRSCSAAARLRLIGLKRPPAAAELWRWIELVQLVPGVGDNAVVAQLRAAASSHHPHLRYLARSALREVAGRPPKAAKWEADPRRPPAEPLARPELLTLETDAGNLTLRLRPDWAPVTAAYVLGLVKRGEFKANTIHRVVPGFVVQGGDRTGTGFGGDTSLMLSEWSGARFTRGVVGLAHAGKDTEGSQLFVTLGPAPHLDGRYTAFGEITTGIDVAERLLPGARLRIRVGGGGKR